jgi:TonB family protein
MDNDSPPGSPRPAAGGEFAWPPTREELDAIEVIQLDDTSSARPIAVVPAKAAMVAPPIARRGRLRLPRRLPRRDDLVFAGAVLTSVLAIAVAASMQFSDVWRPPVAPPEPPEQTASVDSVDRPIAPLIAQALPAMSPIATAPLALTATVLPASPGNSVNVASGTSDRHARIGSRAVERRQVPAPGSRASRSARSAAYTRTAYTRNAAIAKPSMRPARDEDYSRPRLISPERGRNGKLVLLVEVRKNGKVGDVDVLSSNLDRENRSHRDLQRAAISTVKRWRYTPAVRDGEPTDTQVRVVVDINLDSGAIGSVTEADARRRVAAANRAVDSVRAAR